VGAGADRPGDCLDVDIALVGDRQARFEERGPDLVDARASQNRRPLALVVN
jgi:hypothetical protein